LGYCTHFTRIPAVSCTVFVSSVVTPLSPHYPEYLQQATPKTTTSRYEAAATNESDQPDGMISSDLNASRAPSSFIRPAYDASISLTVPIVNQVALHNRRRLGQAPSAGQDEVDFSGSLLLHRQVSYDQAIELGSLDKGEVQDRNGSGEDESKCVSYSSGFMAIKWITNFSG